MKRKTYIDELIERFRKDKVVVTEEQILVNVLERVWFWNKQMYSALNQVPNTRINGEFRNTYALLAQMDLDDPKDWIHG